MPDINTVGVIIGIICGCITIFGALVKYFSKSKNPNKKIRKDEATMSQQDSIKNDQHNETREEVKKDHYIECADINVQGLCISVVKTMSQKLSETELKVIKDEIGLHNPAVVTTQGSTFEIAHSLFEAAGRDNLIPKLLLLAVETKPNSTELVKLSEEAQKRARAL